MTPSGDAMNYREVVPDDIRSPKFGDAGAY
jgi:hypothetical protein